jgi:hypothetical protein
MIEKEMWETDLYEYSMQNILRMAKSLPTWDLNKIYYLGL